jgi:DNA repair exonuclease SbcCD nuclease subunit
VNNNKLFLKFTLDQKTGAKITGIRGKKGSLDRKDYELLDVKSLEQEKGFKIFMFHTAIDELKPADMEKMDSIPASELPSGFDYYAGGHVHIVDHKDMPDYKNLIYSGPIFPANFSELWKLGKGGFYIYEDEKLEYQPINLMNVFRIEISAEDKTAEEVNHVLEASIQGKEFNHTIALIRVSGMLKNGKPSDVDFKSIIRELYSKSAFFVMRNTSQLTSKEFEEVRVGSGTAEQIEEALIKEYAGKSKASFAKKEEEMIKNLIQLLGEEQKEGERKYEYDAKMKKQADAVLNI